MSVGEAVTFGVRQYLRSTAELYSDAIDWTVEGAEVSLAAILPNPAEILYFGNI